MDYDFSCIVFLVGNRSCNTHESLSQCFPESVDINAAVDLIQQVNVWWFIKVSFYFHDSSVITTNVILYQCSSTEVTCESGAVMAATLANGGLCPLSGDQVLSPSSARAMLSMMQVAGMNDYSKLFHFKVLSFSPENKPSKLAFEQQSHKHTKPLNYIKWMQHFVRCCSAGGKYLYTSKRTPKTTNL